MALEHGSRAMMRILLTLLLIVAAGFGWWWYAQQTGYGYLGNRHKYFYEPMREACKDRTILDFVPSDSEPGLIYPLSTDIGSLLEDVPSMLVYGVKVIPPTMQMRISSLKDPTIVGIVAAGFFDGDQDYSESDLSVVEFNPTNGAHSNGDIVYIFRR